jgi:hypothetical protein
VPLMAVVFPIVPGKTEAWRAWMAELNGPRRAEFEASRQNAGVHERTFLQSTPMGDLVIVTMEGDDPARSFGTMMGTKDDFTAWFIEQATEMHGFDPSVVVAGPPSELVVDSGSAVVVAA